MRILHTSDWHLGRSFHREDLLGHQGVFVDHLLDVVERERVDVVVVSGDVYDRALPHVDAVHLADEAFARLAASPAQVVVTSGNHDSAQRLGFGSRLIDARRPRRSAPRSSSRTSTAPSRSTPCPTSTRAPWRSPGSCRPGPTRPRSTPPWSASAPTSPAAAPASGRS